LKALPLVREGISAYDFHSLSRLAEMDPKTIGEILEDPELYMRALKASENASSKWAAALFLFNIQGGLGEAKRKVAKSVLVKLLMQLASQISGRGIRSTERFLTSYKPGLEEVDLEETLDGIISKPSISYDDIIVVDRRPKKRGILLILDTSNSMYREKMLIAVLAIGVMAYRLRGENYAIIAFNSEGRLLKPIEREMETGELLDRVLEIRAGGCTNLNKALEMGLEQLSKNVAHEKVAILVTDGWVTAGGSPFANAAKYPRLHVIQVPMGVGGGDTETCLRLAREGRGKRIFVKDFRELPRAIIEILR